MGMNTYYVKLSGKANIPEQLSIGHNYKITADCSITSESKVDNEDGSFSITWKAEPVTVEIERDNGEKIKAKDTRRNSQKIRNFLWKLHEQEGYGEDFDKVYDEATWIILRDLPITLREAIKKIKG